MPHPETDTPLLPTDGRPCGRFAPSPTGPLHFGSLVAALGSRLDALHRGGRWRVRIDDLDPPREVRGASRDILATLEAHGLHWDGAVRYQSRHADAYERALADLDRCGLVYGCSCTRREIAALGERGPGGPVYPGLCRGGPRRPERRTALRLRVDAKATVAFDDRLFGRRRAAVAATFGDFVVRRRDGLHAYHLATVVDDAEMGVTDVVRGADLLDPTVAQLHLARLLGHAPPAFLHLPVALAADGRKLSKQTGAVPLPGGDPRPALVAALEHLGQQPPADLRGAPLDALWAWAIARWDPARIGAAPRRAPDLERYEL